MACDDMLAYRSVPRERRERLVRNYCSAKYPKTEVRGVTSLLFAIYLSNFLSTSVKGHLSSQLSSFICKLCVKTVAIYHWRVQLLGQFALVKTLYCLEQTCSKICSVYLVIAVVVKSN